MTEPCASDQDPAKAALDRYLGETAQIPHALLVSAPWGAGKTTWLKDYFEKRRKEHDDSKDPLIISLFGLRSVDDVRLAIREAAMPGGSTVVDLIGDVLDTQLSKRAGKGVAKKFTKSITQMAEERLSGRVYVFDDLERCEGDVVSILGFINRLVEKRGQKVILLADETRLRKNKSLNWGKRAEKLVGRRITVAPDPSEVLLQAANADGATAALKYVVGKQGDVILKTFAMSGCRNLRSLLWSAQTSGSIIEQLGGTDLADSLQEAIVHAIVAFELHSRKGGFGKIDVSSLDEVNPLGLAMARSKGALSKAQAAADRFLKTFYRAHIESPVLPFTMLNEAMTTGTIDRAAAMDHLRQRFYMDGTGQTLSWRELWYMEDKSPQELDFHIDKVSKELQAKQHTQSGPILHITGLAVAFAKRGDQTLTQGKDVPAYFTDYIAQLETAGTLEPLTRPIAIGQHGSWGGLGYAEQASPEFQVILAALNDAAMRVSVKSLTQDGERAAAAARERQTLTPLSEFLTLDRANQPMGLATRLPAAEVAALVVRSGEGWGEFQQALLGLNSSNMPHETDHVDWFKAFFEATIQPIDEVSSVRDRIMAQERVTYFAHQLDKDVAGIDFRALLPKSWPEFTSRNAGPSP